MKEKQLTTFSIRMSQHNLQRLDTWAQHNGTSRNTAANILIRDAINADKHTPTTQPQQQ